MKVCTFVQAVKLRGLGVLQQCEMYWCGPTRLKKGKVHGIGVQCYAAYDVAELGIMLGYGISMHAREENEAQHRADALIRDLETGFLTVGDVNHHIKNNL